MTRLLRIPIVLAFAALAGFGAYALGFKVFADNFNVALTAAAVSGVVVTVGLGSLTRVVGLVLLGIPIAVAAIGTWVYVAGMADVDAQPRFQVVVASARCTHTYTHHTNRGPVSGCDRHEFTFTDTSGKAVTDELYFADTRDGRDVGERLDVYLQKPGTMRLYPKTFADPLANVEKVSRIAVPVLVFYVILCGIVGTVGHLARRAVVTETDRW